MAHFARVDENGVVREVIVVDNSVLGEPVVSFPETESLGRMFIQDVLRLQGTWLQTSYNNNIRGAYAGPGFVYDKENDVFVPPAPEPEETPNED